MSPSHVYHPLPPFSPSKVFANPETPHLSDVSAHGTVLRDCVVEGLRLIFTLDGVEDDEETRDDEGTCIRT